VTFQPPPLERYRKEIEQALTHSIEISTFDRVSEAVRSGHAQYWPLGNSVIITQIAAGGVLHFWIAGGNMQEIQAATPTILAWGKEQGCTIATLTGRRGWLRSFLGRTGWKESRIVNMECAL